MQVVLVNSSDFRAIHSWNACQSPKSKKITKTSYLGSSRSFKVINVNISKKLVASACYNKQHVRAYLQPFLR